MKECPFKKKLILACVFMMVCLFLRWSPFPGSNEIVFKPEGKHYRDESKNRDENEISSSASYQPKEPKHTNYDKNLYPQPWRVLNIEIQYIINNDVCGHFGAKPEVENEDRISIINLIHTHASHFETRQKIRDSFTQEDLKSVGMRRVFLLANPDRTQFHQGNLNQINSKISTSASNKTILEFWSNLTAENGLHSDLVMGDFIENYRNMTYKHLMGLNWALKFCPQATFIIKQDDDTAVDFYQVRNLLDFATKSHENSSLELVSNISPEKMNLALRLREKLSTSSESKSKSFGMGQKYKDRRFFMGKNEIHLAPERANSKWAVTQTEFPDKVYPNFIYGWFYVTTMESARGIVQASRHRSARFFWMDDVFITGILRERAGIELISAEEFGTIIPEELAPCLDSMNGVVTNRKIPAEKQITKDGTFLKMTRAEEQKGSWCKNLAVMLHPHFLDYLTPFHKEAKWCYFTHRCGSS